MVRYLADMILYQQLCFANTTIECKSYDSEVANTRSYQFDQFERFSTINSIVQKSITYTEQFWPFQKFSLFNFTVDQSVYVDVIR